MSAAGEKPDRVTDPTLSSRRGNRFERTQREAEAILQNLVSNLREHLRAISGAGSRGVTKPIGPHLPCFSSSIIDHRAALLTSPQGGCAWPAAALLFRRNVPSSRSRSVASALWTGRAPRNVIPAKAGGNHFRSLGTTRCHGPHNSGHTSLDAWLPNLRESLLDSRELLVAHLIEHNAAVEHLAARPVF